MCVGAERPKTWGGSSQKLGQIDRVWGGRGADRPGADRLWGGSTGTRDKVSSQVRLFCFSDVQHCLLCVITISEFALNVDLYLASIVMLIILKEKATRTFSWL